MKQRLILLLLIAVVSALPALLRAQTDVTCEDISIEGADAAFFVGLGDAYNDVGNRATAIIAYTCAIERFPEYAPAYVSRGSAHAAQNNDPAAMADYEAALALDANSITAYNNRGLLYTRQGNFGLAIADFTVAVTLQPDYAPGFNNRGVVHAIEGSIELAIVDLEQAIALDPEYAAPRASLGAVYLALAAEQYAAYSDIAGRDAPIPNGDAGYMLTNIQQSEGNYSAWLAFQTPAR